MSDTPETDAAIKSQSEWKLPFVSYTMGGVTYDGPVATLCRKLERERDEAIQRRSIEKINMNWDEYAMGIAEAVAKKSKDPWQKVGAVILREDNSIASVGFNGFPQGQEEDWSDREERRKYVIHAEQNALRYTNPGEGKTLVSTLLPCRDCLKTIAAYKIKRVLYKEVYKSDPIALEIAEKMGVTLSKL